MASVSQPIERRRARNQVVKPRPRDTVDRILRAAAQEFCTKGLLGGSIEQISRSAGTTKQLVYYYFKSKEQLYTTVLDEVSAQSVQDLLPGQYHQMGPLDALQRFIEGVFDQHVNRPTLAGLVLDQNLHQCAHMTHRNKFTAKASQVMEILADIIRRGVAAGTIRADVRADYLYVTICMLTSGYFTSPIVVSMAFPEPNLQDTEQVARWRAYAVSFILNSIRPYGATPSPIV